MEPRGPCFKIWPCTRCCMSSRVRGASRKVMREFSKAPALSHMRVISEVHSTGPVILKLSRHCFIITLAGDTLILFTAAYKSFISSSLTILTSRLGKNEMAIHLWSKRKVGWWMSLVRGCTQRECPEICFQKVFLLNLGRAESKFKLHVSSKPKYWLSVSHVRLYSMPNILNVTWVLCSWSVHRNWMVRKREPSSKICEAFSHPR